MLRTFFIVVAVVAVVGCGFGVSQPFALAQKSITGETASPVIVELFTSQGCSSCPPADRLLTEIAKLSEKQKLPIYCLSFHVDYWNSLGWDDPYSSKLFTRRQRNYSAAFGNDGVYTPQMIVNGKTEFVGSRGRDAQQAIEAALSTPATSQVALKAVASSDKNSAKIEFNVTGNQSNAVLNIALVQNQAGNQVPRGENSGRSLTHVSVVRALQTIALDKNPSGKVEVKLPAGLKTDDASIVAYVQDARMQISGANVTSL